MNTKLTFKQIIMAGAVASGASVVINAILFFIFHVAGIIADSVFIQPNQPLTVIPVIISSIFPTLIGACVFFLFEKFSVKGFQLFSIIALILMVLSLASPFMAVQGMPVAYALVLCVMHIVVALSLLFFIKRAKK
jgi:hypothetical protein